MLLQMSGFRATKSGDAFRLEQKFEEVYVNILIPDYGYCRIHSNAYCLAPVRLDYNDFVFASLEISPRLITDFCPAKQKKSRRRRRP